MSGILVLCCADCDKPVVTTEGRGSYCLHCDYAPSMQDTHFRRIERQAPTKAHKYDVAMLRGLMRDGVITKADLQAALDEIS